MKLKIKQRIYLGYFILIFIFIVSAVISAITLNNNKNKVSNISHVIDPSLESINDFNILITESKMLATNWVYLQSNQSDKDDLKNLHETKYPQLKKKLNKQKAQWEDKQLSKVMDSVFTSFEELLQVEKTIMQQLNSFESYEDPIIKFEAESLIENDILPKSAKVMEKLRHILYLKQKEKDAFQENLIASSDSLTLSMLGLSVLLIIIGSITALFMSKSIISPINQMQQMVNSIAKGELKKFDIEIGDDEIGEMANSIKGLTVGLRNTANFASNIGEGKFNSDFQPLSDKDVLGMSLMLMRDNLKRVAEEDAQRNWASAGLTRFADILRSSDNNREVLANNIISNLVKYLNANQGAIFVIGEDEMENQCLDMVACYAYDRRKYLMKRLDIKEGLLGQSVSERDTIFITDVPDGYVSITSGLGESTPRCIVIVPLKVNEEVFGVIEIASFSVLRPFEIEFIEKLSESIASTFSTVQINERTQRLLEQSQLQAEQMKAQEEEMRQNLEELMTTQEQMAKASHNFKKILTEDEMEMVQSASI